MIGLPFAVGAKLERDTGCTWVADRLACNPFGFHMRIEDAVLGNTPDFGQGRPMMNIRSFEATASLKSLAAKTVVIERASLNLSRISLIIDERGKLNLEQFAKDLFGEARGTGDKLRIAHCDLKIETVEILDYSSPEPTHKAVRMGVDIKDFQAEGVLGIFRPLFEIVARAEYLPEGFAGIVDPNMAGSTFSE